MASGSSSSKFNGRGSAPIVWVCACCNWDDKLTCWFGADDTESGDPGVDWGDTSIVPVGELGDIEGFTASCLNSDDSGLFSGGKMFKSVFVFEFGSHQKGRILESSFSLKFGFFLLSSIFSVWNSESVWELE